MTNARCPHVQKLCTNLLVHSLTDCRIMPPHKGEEGDRFYIVEAGACHVLGADGHSVGQRLG